MGATAALTEAPAAGPPPVSDYQARKEAGICTRPGCERRAGEDSALCTQCHRAQKRFNREAMQRKREARRAAKLCVWCPGYNPARATEGSTSCQPCRVKRRRIRAADGGVGRGVDRDQRIAARTVTHADGRTRYHGQGKKGQQPKAQLLAQDARLARERFEAFEAGVMLLGSDEAATWTRGERERVEKAIASCGESAGRHIDDGLDKLGHFRERHGRRDQRKDIE